MATLGQAMEDGRSSETKGGTKGQGASVPSIVKWAHQMETTCDPAEVKGMIQGPHELQAVADKLGLSLGQLNSALRSGKTLADLAGDTGVPMQELSDAAALAAKARLDKALNAGRIDQAATDAILANVQNGQWIDKLVSAYEKPI
ncbi:MAG TPA: hypothetical protein VHS28_09420 [Chloroflexota bacterium]|nr:hypothetical protein [Chloroflexota bacterium]